MCGIFCLAGPNNYDGCNILNERLQKRGPDGWCKYEQHLDEEIKLEFVGSTLHLRGNFTPQPLVSEVGNTLLWNGEIFHMPELKSEDNDTFYLFQCLNKSINDDAVLRVLTSIEGPYACIYWQRQEKKLWFSRDILGRRSLLMHLGTDDNRCFALSSLTTNQEKSDYWQEVPTTGIFCVNMESFREGTLLIKHYHWFPPLFDISPKPSLSHEFNATPKERDDLENEPVILKDISFIHCRNKRHHRIAPFCWSMPLEDDLQEFSSISNDLIIPDNFIPVVEDFISVLSQAVELRVKNVPKHCKQCKLKRLSQPFQIDDHHEEGKRCIGQLAEYHLDSLPPCSHCKVAILFSGGIDSCMLAALSDKYIPLEEPIDLLNVAFQTKNTHNEIHHKGKQKKSIRNENVKHEMFHVPDRITGLEALKELKVLSPTRQWNFVNIDVNIEELQKQRLDSVCHVLSPSKTVLDDSIGCAVWFAARGAGKLHEKDTVLYESPAEVVLVGMGADEQLAGYSRHRVKFQSGGWKALMEELNLEMKRISNRNLGRDDRIISDHGKESRLPFLDENVVSFLNKLPVWHKANLNLPRGIGEKLLLRMAAKRIGLQNTSLFHKRAIQFGSRIAKAENNREKGADICQRL